MLGSLQLIPAALPADAPSKLSQAQLLLAVIGIVIVLLGALAVLTLVRRLGRRTLAETTAKSKVRRIPRSPWSEAGKRARPVDQHGNLPDDDEPRDKDDLEETH